MPFFNHGMFVADAVASVRAQSRPVDEIVIIDDGSTDAQSLEALDRLESEGVVVLHQANQGPSAARNAGVDRSSGDAVLFLDSDDLLSGRQVEVALRTLSAAPLEVGFAYPDMQFFGNERDLVVMPPYNLYLLLHRNFCGMGSLIDRSVFEGGAQFRTDLLRGHEDWDFFLNLGRAGVFGAVFHGEPLRWRRWGYSRSDSVQEERGSFLGEIRDLHPDLYDSRRLIELKQVWSPALSVVAPPGPPAPATAQTCDDFEVVTSSADSPLPAVRGRWVLLLGEVGRSWLADPTFVERSLRLVADRPSPVALGLVATAPSGPWTRAEADPSGASAGVVVDGDAYDEWRRSARPKGHGGAEALLRHLAPLGEPAEWWAIPTPAPGRSGTAGGTPRRVRPALPPPEPGTAPTPGSGRDGTDDPPTGPAELGMATEIGFRRFEATPLFIPAGGFARLPAPPRGYRDGLEAVTRRAWSHWTPSRTRRLDLVVDRHGRAFLETVDDEEGGVAERGAGGTARRAIGRLWVRPFPGTACLYQSVDVRTHYYSYRVTNDAPRDRYELPVGYVAIEPLEGMVDLGQVIDEESRANFGGRRVAMVPPLDVGPTGAFIEPFAPAMGQWVPGDDGTPEPRRWPLYELLTSTGGYRYTRSPDACVGRADLRRPTANAVVELVEPSEGGGLSGLHEVRFTETGGAGYVSGHELAAGLDHLEPVRTLGDIAEQPGVNTPMVRLHPASPEMAAPGDPGHRLAIDWEPLTAAGYVVEGVVGFGWAPDPARAPLYRWRRAAGPGRRLTLGERPDDTGDDWIFEGTLGSAWRPGTHQAGLVDLWELALGDDLVFSTVPEAWEAGGFSSRRVVARVLAATGPGLVPLFGPRVGGGPRLPTTAPQEGSGVDEGEPGILGYLEVAVPSPEGSEASVPTPDWAVPIDETDGGGLSLRGLLARVGSAATVPVVRTAGGARVELQPGPDGDLLGHALRGPAPFASPVYSLRRAADGVTALSTTPPGSGGWEITGVRCFVLSAESTDPGPALPSDGAAPGGPAAPLRGRLARAVASNEIVRRHRLGRFVPAGVRRRLRRGRPGS